MSKVVFSVINPLDTTLPLEDKEALEKLIKLSVKWTENKANTEFKEKIDLRFITLRPYFVDLHFIATKLPKEEWWKFWELIKKETTYVLGPKEDNCYVFLVLGAGGWAGAKYHDKSSKGFYNWCIIGDAVIGPILRYYNPITTNSYEHLEFDKDAWQVQTNTALGTLIHEMCHALFNLGHEDEIEDKEHIMQKHNKVDINDFSKSKFLQKHVDMIRNSEFMTYKKKFNLLEWILEKLFGRKKL